MKKEALRKFTASLATDGNKCAGIKSATLGSRDGNTEGAWSKRKCQKKLFANQMTADVKYKVKNHFLLTPRRRSYRDWQGYGD